MIKKNNLTSYIGFTLIEILIALFVFSILSIILMTALRTVINAQSGTENKAQRLREVQMTLLMMSRDIEQIVNRPIINTSGKEDPAFVGTSQSFSFTHLGYANPTDITRRSSLQRTGYEWRDDQLWRLTAPVLDQAPKTKLQQRSLLNNVTSVRFEYLDQKNRFFDHWPLENGDQPLPVGVKLSLTISSWGELTQFYLIAAQANKNAKTNES
jgi:general secretion pathway protein J